MHGMINRSIEGFLRGTYGDTFWIEVAEITGVDVRGFQTVRNYPDAITRSLITSAAGRLNKPPTELLEDMGAWLAQVEPVRRLLRFSGQNFPEFLLALDELPGRVQMVISDLEMPRIRVETGGPEASGQISVILLGCFPEWGSVMAGLIRTMADDYGALSLILADGNVVSVHISDDYFAEGRRFELFSTPENGSVVVTSALAVQNSEY